jgi:type II secretory pathway pseudopilin PulG
MERSEDGPRARRRAALHKTIPELLLESGMIVLSVLLALAANSWADSRRQDQLAEQARRAFVLELRANRAGGAGDPLP